MQATATYTTTYSATLDGDDQTIAIRNFLAAVPDGTPEAPTVIRFDAGRYHTEGDLANNPRGANGVILLQNRCNLIIEGPSPTDPAIFYTTAPAVPYATNVDNNNHSLRRHFWLKNCTNITLRNLRVEGSNYTEGKILVAGTPVFWEGGADNGSQPGFPGYRASWELEHAFDVTDSQNITIEDCSVDSVWGDGVYVGNSPKSGSNGVTLRRLHLRWTGRQGVGAANCRNVLMDGITVDHGRRAAIDLEPFSDSGFVTDVEICNCTLHPLQTQFAAFGRGDVSRINIHDNTLYGTGGTLLCADSGLVARRSDWTLRNNIRVSNFGSPLAPLRFTMTDNIVIDSNTIPVVATQSRKCVTFNDCQGALLVTNNNFGQGTLIEAINSAPVVNEGNSFGT